MVAEVFITETPVAYAKSQYPIVTISDHPCTALVQLGGLAGTLGIGASATNNAREWTSHSFECS